MKLGEQLLTTENVRCLEENDIRIVYNMLNHVLKTKKITIYWISGHIIMHLKYCGIKTLYTYMRKLMNYNLKI